MSSIIQSWMLVFLEKEFENAYECLHPAFRLGSVTEVDRYRCTPSSVSVHSTSTKRLQLIDFNYNRKAPFNNVSLSDSELEIRADFNKDCTKEFASREGRSFAEGTVGGVISITDYTFAFCPNNIPLFKLQINKFQLLGSEGSSTFGSPSITSTTNRLRDLEAKLKGLISGANRSSQNHAESPIMTQADGLNSSERPFPKNFATQVQVSNQMQRSSPVSQTLVQGVSAPPAAKGAKLLAALANSSKQQAVPKIPANAAAHVAPKGASLLAALAQSGKGQTINKCPTPAAKPVTTNSTVEHAETKKASRASPMAHSVGAEIFSQMPSQVEAQASITRGRSPMSAQSSEFSGELASTKDSLSNSSRALQSAVNVDKSISARAVTSILTRTVGQKEPTENNNATENVPFSFLDLEKELNPFEGMKRIPRSYVRVPPDQRQVLDRNTSWITPGSNYNPVHMISPEVLEDLRNFAKNNPDSGFHQAAQSANQNKNEAIDSGVDSQGSETEESDDSGSESDNRLASQPEADAQKPLSGHTNLENALDDESSDDDQKSWSITPEKKTAGNHDFEIPSDDDQEEGTDLNPEGDSGMPDHSPSPIPDRSLPTPSLPPSNQLGRLDKSFKARDFAFPSSSPEDEEELEVDVAHAIGDEVESDIEMEAAPEPSQVLPSTATHNVTIEVEQTPFAIGRSTGRPAMRDSSRRALRGIAKGLDISSDPVIPATFDENNSQSKDRHAQQEQKAPTFAGSTIANGEESLDPDKSVELEDNTKDDKVVDEEHLLVECKSSQPVNKHKSVNSGRVSPSERNGPTLELENESTEVKPTSGNSTKHDSRQPMTRGPSSLANSGESSTSKRNLKGASEVVSNPASKRRWSNDHAKVNISELTRALSRKFTDETAATDSGTRTIPATIPPSHVVDQDAMEDNQSNEGISIATAEVIPSTCDAEQESYTGSTYSESISNFRTGSVSASDRFHLVPAELRTWSGPSRKCALSSVDQIMAQSAYSASEAAPVTPLEKFTSMYPSYEENEQRFIDAVCYIDWLATGKSKCPDESFWDDMIIFLASDYREYIRERREQAAKRLESENQGSSTKEIETEALNAVDYFFKTYKDKKPVYNNRVITKSTIKDTLASLNQDLVTETMEKFYKPRGSRRISSSATLTAALLEAGKSSEPITTTGSKKRRISDQQSGGIENPVAKRRFFETPSQISVKETTPTASKTSVPDPIVGTPGSGSRKLPWETTSRPGSSVKSHPDPPPFTPLKRTSPTPGHQGPQNLLDPFLSQKRGSPILGSNPQTVTRAIHPTTPRAALSKTKKVKSKTETHHRASSNRKEHLAFNEKLGLEEKRVLKDLEEEEALRVEELKQEKIRQEQQRLEERRQEKEREEEKRQEEKRQEEQRRQEEKRREEKVKFEKHMALARLKKSGGRPARTAKARTSFCTEPSGTSSSRRNSSDLG